jgi:hypothetical protein
VTDVRETEWRRVVTARRGVVRLCAHGDAADPGGVRVLMVSDVVFRVVETRGAQALYALLTPASGADGTALKRRIARLGLHVPDLCATDGDVDATLGGPPDLRLAPSGTVPDGDAPVLTVGPVTGPGADGDEDPAPLRLALLAVPHDRPASLTPAALTEADRTLERWRSAVAGWAEHPSAPIPPPFAAAARAALEDLDTPRLLELLGEVAEDAAIAPGARFETFAWAERVLALDLVGLVGRSGMR